MESNKTRIETIDSTWVLMHLNMVGGWNPIKQGLKRAKLLLSLANKESRRMESNKTRIETFKKAHSDKIERASEDGIQ